MKIARMWALTKIVIHGHILNWPWRERSHRRRVRTDYTARVATQYFKRYLPAAARVKEEAVVKDDKNDKIFTIWLQGEAHAPKLVKACFKSVRKYCKQELVILDADTIFDYIDLPDEIVKKYRDGKLVMRISPIYVVLNCCIVMGGIGWMQPDL